MFTKGEMAEAKTMAYAEAKRNLDRWEADLLLNVVFAHITFRSTQDSKGREVVHDRFAGAVRQLYQFLTTEYSEEDTTTEI